MEDVRQSRRVTIRLTPWQARRLWQLRTADLPEGKPPRTTTEVLLRAITEPNSATVADEEEKTHTDSAPSLAIVP